MNKYIAQSGITSRRKADNLIISGNVKINGKPVLTPGVEVTPGDSVEVNGKTIQLKKYPLLRYTLSPYHSRTYPD